MNGKVAIATFFAGHADQDPDRERLALARPAQRAGRVAAIAHLGREALHRALVSALIAG
jgi:hypothetical protein